MLNKNMTLLLFYLALIGFSLHAAAPQITKKEITTNTKKIISEKFTTKNEEEDKEEEEEDNKEEEEIIPKLTPTERSKCNKLQTALVGNCFDGKRIAAFLTSNIVGYGIETTTVALMVLNYFRNHNYQDTTQNIQAKGTDIMNKFKGDPLQTVKSILLKGGLVLSATWLTSYLVSLCIHLGLLKQQKVSAITSTIEGAALNPAGLAVYSLLHRFVLSSNLINVLESYDHNQIPACVKTKFDKLIQEYEETNNLGMNSFQRSTFVINILSTLDKALARR